MKAIVRPLASPWLSVPLSSYKVCQKMINKWKFNCTCNLCMCVSCDNFMTSPQEGQSWYLCQCNNNTCSFATNVSYRQMTCLSHHEIMGWSFFGFHILFYFHNLKTEKDKLYTVFERSMIPDSEISNVDVYTWFIFYYPNFHT